MSATFKVKRGDTWRQPFYWRQGSETGDPVDLTGCTFRMHVRDSMGALILDCTDHLTVNHEDGEVIVEIDIPGTIVIPRKPYKFDIEVTWPDGSVRSTATAYLNIIQDETHA